MRGLKRFLAISVVVCVAATTASAQVKLEFKFPENQKYRVEETVLVDQVMTINGMEVPTKSEQTITSRMAMGAKRADGSVPVTQTVDTIKMQLDLPGGISMSIDSEDKGAPPADELPQLKPLRDTVKAIAGSSFVVVMGKDGKVAAIEGTEDAVKHAEGLDPQVAEALKKRFDIGQLKQASEEQFGVFPETLVRPGETWVKKQTMNIGSGQTLTFERKYEYLGTEDRDGRKLDKVAVKATSVNYAMDASGGDGQVSIPKSDLKVDSSDGTIFFDRELGRIVESKINTRIVGDMTIVIQGMELESKLDLKLGTESAIKPGE